MSRPRFNMFAVSLLTSYFSLLTSSPAQGPLTPPGGPAPMMRSLDQIEPRIPITSLPYTISESGSYMVTGPLASTNHGIVIHAHNVTVDLMGFTITGSGSTNFHGILAQGGEGIPLRNVHIRNGGVQQFEEGLRFQNVNGGSIRSVTAIQNVGYGMNMTSLSSPGNASANIIIENCEVHHNGAAGINISGNGLIRGIAVRKNYLSGNSGIGMRLVMTEGCILTDNIIGPQVLNNDTSYGIFTHQSPLLFMARNVSIDNETGFIVAGVRGPVVGLANATLSDTGPESHPHANFHIRPD